MKHKHADLIHAWADGAEIQYYDLHEKQWFEETPVPRWHPDTKYRIKPEEKKPVVRWLWAYNEQGCWFITSSYSTEEETKNFEWIKNPIKLEWSRTEFPE